MTKTTIPKHANSTPATMKPTPSMPASERTGGTYGFPIMLRSEDAGGMKINGGTGINMQES